MRPVVAENSFFHNEAIAPERLNEELRRERVIRIFPNRASAVCLLVSRPTSF